MRQTYENAHFRNRRIASHKVHHILSDPHPATTGQYRKITTLYCFNKNIISNKDVRCLLSFTPSILTKNSEDLKMVKRSFCITPICRWYGIRWHFLSSGAAQGLSSRIVNLYLCRYRMYLYLDISQKVCSKTKIDLTLLF